MENRNAHISPQRKGKIRMLSQTENELIAKRREARKTIDDFPTLSAAADADRQRAENLHRTKPSDVYVDGLTVGRLMQLIDAVESGDESLVPPELMATRAKCWRLVEGYQAAKHYLRTTADPKLHRQLEEAHERMMPLARAVGAATELREHQKHVAEFRRELERRQNEVPSFTANRPPDSQLQFDLKAAQDAVANCHDIAGVLARGQQAEGPLAEIQAEIKQLEAAFLIPENCV
jgi:hypothetical protein